LLAKIKSAHPSLRKSEQKVADVILADPDASVESSIQLLANQAHVSEPTVIRFCRALGCVGFQDFKLKLAKDLARQGTFFYRDVSAEDSGKELSDKIIDSAIASLVHVKNQLDFTALEKAIEYYHAADKVEFYGSGGSGVVAQDAQLKFFRLGKPALAYSDPHIQHATAALLNADSLVIAISASGRNEDLLHTISIAKETRAKVIAITATGSPLAATADLAITLDVVEDSDIFSPIKSRLAQIVVLDMLAVGAAVKGGEEMTQRLERSSRAIDFKFVK